MTFLEALQSHKGGLLHLKTELFWYGGPGWDDSPGRICLVLDVAATATAAVATATAAATVTAAAFFTAAGTAGALLLIDDRPQWIWVSQQDVEIL